MMRRYEAQPPKLDPEISVVAGELLDVCVGKPPDGPFIRLNGVTFVPRRPYRSVPQPLGDALARARKAMDER